MGTFTKLRGGLRQARGDYSIAAIGNSLYAYGGYAVTASTDWYCTPLSTVERFDVASQTWVPAGFDMKIASAEKDDGVAIGNRLYVIGGEVKSKAAGCGDTDIVPLSKVYSIDVTTATGNADWSDHGDLPAGRMRFSAEAFEGSVYIFGGQGALVDYDTLPIMYSALKIDGAAGPAAAALSGGAIAGIVIAALVVFCKVVFVVLRCRARPVLSSKPTNE